MFGTFLNQNYYERKQASTSMGECLAYHVWNHDYPFSIHRSNEKNELV